MLDGFYVTVTRKPSKPLSTGAAIEAVDAFGAFPVREPGPGLVRAAVRQSAYDQTCGRLRAVDPFRNDLAR